MQREIVNSVAYANGIRIGDVELDCVHTVLQQPDVFVWIGLYEPREELLRLLQQEFGLHDLAIEDAHCAHQRPKIERYGDSLFVVLRTAQMNTTLQKVEFGETHIFVGKRYLLSVRHGPSNPYTELRARAETMPHLLRYGPGFVLYTLMDFIVDQYFPVIDALEGRLELLEDMVFGEKFNRETTAHIYELQRELLQVKRVVAPLVEICNRLTRFEHPEIPEATHIYFRDVYDHIIRVNEMLDMLRELLTTTLEATFSLISITQNEVMKRFAGWAAIIAVPTMIAGIYGMNFEHMPELSMTYSYPALLLVTASICMALWLYFRRAGWL